MGQERRIFYFDVGDKSDNGHKPAKMSDYSRRK